VNSILKPDASTMAGLATVAAVYGIYQMNVGSVSMAHVTDPNAVPLESSRKKAGMAALALVASLFLITHDGNLLILGAGTVVAMELSYRHAIMADPNSNQMIPPVGPNAYEPAENVVAFPYQGQTG
jgi:hypothetical protein